MANSHGTSVDTQWGGKASLFGGEGGFGLRVTGHGTCVVSVYGAIDIFDLAPDQVVTVDTGHVVAYDLNIRFQMRRAVQGKSIQSLKSGEGWVFDFAGPGRVILQSRNPEAFAQWARSLSPGNNPKSGIGGLGGMFS
jgi:uncharacterized protein (AIM24 family)